MTINKKKAFAAGLVGGALMTAVFMILNAIGVLETSMSMTLGTLLRREPSMGTWFFGFGLHLLLSGLVGVLYAMVFEARDRRRPASPGLGALIGIAHAGIGGLALGLLPQIHWLMPDFMAAPGIYMTNIWGGWGAALFFGLHLLYGATVGAVYRREPAVFPAHSLARWQTA